MLSWFRDTTRFQRASLMLLALALLNQLRGAVTGDGSSVGLIVAFGLLTFYAFRQRLLWRVRNRLLLNFLLVGIVPLLLIAAMVAFSVQIGLGELATRRVGAEIASTLTALREQAEARAEGRVPARKLEGSSLVIGQAPGESPTVTGVMHDPNGFSLAAVAHVRNVKAIASVALDAEFLRSVARGDAVIGAIASGDEDVNIHADPAGTEVTVRRTGGREAVLGEALLPRQGWWDLTLVGLLPEPMIDGARQDASAMLVVLSRPSMIAKGMFTGPVGRTLGFVLGGFAVVLLVIDLVSVFASIRLTQTITRSVHDLYVGTQHVSEGDFAHQIPVRGKNQLSVLASSFNSMTTQIQRLVGEVKKKEKLEAELEIARRVQARLFPRSVPDVPTLYMLGRCIPGRVVSGDYFDYFRLDDRYTAIALGDVSGKGVSAALLMASIQSSLHAQLKILSAPASPARLMEAISQQLYENTPAEKYATFFLSVYDNATRTLRYTNAGHLAPILVRNGAAKPLEGDGMVAGLLPNVKFEEHEITFEPGDVLILFSDGVPEAEDKAQQEFGEDRLSEIVTRQAQNSLEEIIDTVTKAVDDWAADPEARDDTTILVMRAR